MLAVAGGLGGCYVLVIGRVNTPKRCSPISRCAKDTFFCGYMSSLQVSKLLKFWFSVWRQKS